MRLFAASRPFEDGRSAMLDCVEGLARRVPPWAVVTWRGWPPGLR